ncbi:MAG: class I SAM-dependent methyltransferase [Acidobacteriota bacterium]|nr:class I SAM-dependent methyltransferase [Acidobacteriota bacterium]
MSAPPGVELERAACPLGCPPDDEPVLVGRDRLQNLPGEFSIVRCRRCGILRTDPRPTPASIGFYYPDGYGPYESTGVAAPGPGAARRPAWRRAVSAAVQRLTESKAEQIPRLAPGRMLEIGCAAGSFLDRMAGIGWDVQGIEFSSTAAERARRAGYQVHAGSVESAPEPSELYDLVVGWMVLEHLHDPVAALKKLRGWTRPGGWLAVSVPDASSMQFRLFGAAWYALHLPNHLWHPTRRTIRKVLERAGWKVARVTDQRDVRNLMGSVGYRLRDLGRFPRIARWFSEFPERGGRIYYALHPLALLLAATRQSGRITVWARRND